MSGMSGASGRYGRSGEVKLSARGPGRVWDLIIDSTVYLLKYMYIFKSHRPEDAQAKEPIP